MILRSYYFTHVASATPLKKGKTSGFSIHLVLGDDVLLNLVFDNIIKIFNALLA
jgi:hypothetical protein